MKKLILFVLVIMTYSFSYSQEWELMSETDNREIFIRFHSEDSAWIKLNSTDGYLENLSEAGEVKQALILIRFDCKNKKMGRLAATLYDDDGNVMESEDLKEYQVDMEYVLPDSEGEFWLNNFCNDNVSGDKGNKNGDPNASGYYGNEGSGGGGDYQLGSRRPINKPKPEYECNEEGLVIVTIEVGRSGKVIKATAGTKGSTNTADCLLTKAKEAALKTTWQADSKAGAKQIGIIKYRFSLSN